MTIYADQNHPNQEGQVPGLQMNVLKHDENFTGIFDFDYTEAFNTEIDLKKSSVMDGKGRWGKKEVMFIIGQEDPALAISTIPK